jgi:hypothetical protein
MLQRMRDAVVEQTRQRGDRRCTKIAADHVAAERQRQPAGAVSPPFTEIDLLRPRPRKSTVLRE